VSGIQFIVRGERVGLAAPDHDSFVARWERLNDPELAMVAMRPVAGEATWLMPPQVREQRELLWQRVVSGATLLFDVWELDSDRVVGEARIDGIQWPHASAEFSILLFDAADRGRGIGTEACRLTCAYAFDALGLHRLCIRYLAVNNAVAQAVARWVESFGAKQVGIERENVWAFGAYRDVIVCDVLAHEFPPHEATTALRAEPATSIRT
jgi:RimJ/RimL family protein N-acetyltransferase